MAIRHCPTCNKQFIEAISREGDQLELIRLEQKVYGVKAERVATPTGVAYVNNAYSAVAYVEHECSKMPETLGDPARTPIQEFPTLGDPATERPETPTLGGQE